MADERPTVNVIIPTSATVERGESLMRAIDSILEQPQVEAIPIVVANGPRVCPELASALESRPDIRYIYQTVGSAPAAQLTGRRHVRAPYFGFLDDDDELLLGALGNRVKALRSRETSAVAIDNGFRRVGDVDTPIFDSMITLRSKEPAASLLEKNWMASCSALFRTSLITEDFFEDYVDYNEWTYLALKISLRCEIEFLDSFGYRVYETPASVSTTDQYAFGVLYTLDKMLLQLMPNKIKREIRRKRADTLHELAFRLASSGRSRQAWVFHLKSLCSARGLRYLSSTRHLVRRVNRLPRTPIH